jgi:hypothetical protein
MDVNGQPQGDSDLLAMVPRRHFYQVREVFRIDCNIRSLMLRDDIRREPKSDRKDLANDMAVNVGEAVVAARMSIG